MLSPNYVACKTYPPEWQCSTWNATRSLTLVPVPGMFATSIPRATFFVSQALVIYPEKWNSGTHRYSRSLILLGNGGLSRDVYFAISCDVYFTLISIYNGVLSRNVYFTISRDVYFAISRDVYFTLISIYNGGYHVMSISLYHVISISLYHVMSISLYHVMSISP